MVTNVFILLWVNVLQEEDVMRRKPAAPKAVRGQADGRERGKM